jgi:hypothetical protein
MRRSPSPSKPRRCWRRCCRLSRRAVHNQETPVIVAATAAGIHTSIDFISTVVSRLPPPPPAPQPAPLTAEEEALHQIKLEAKRKRRQERAAAAAAGAVVEEKKQETVLPPEAVVPQEEEQQAAAAAAKSAKLGKTARNRLKKAAKALLVSTRPPLPVCEENVPALVPLSPSSSSSSEDFVRVEDRDQVGNLAVVAVDEDAHRVGGDPAPAAVAADVIEVGDGLVLHPALAPEAAPTLAPSPVPEVVLAST